MVVKSELDKLGLYYTRVDLGEVEIREQITPDQRSALNLALLNSGLELMEDRQTILIERIKAVVIEMVHYSEELPKVNFSTYISEKLNLNYTYLANIFSEVTGNTIERYIIAHRIERVKELLLYDELTLTEISFRLNYSSVAHLSNQFKKTTGLTPTFYKNMKHKKRTSLDKL
jgi:AraC-like DNA-binding protein